MKQFFFCWWLESILNGLKQCHFLVVGIYFEWNGTMLFFWWLESILSGMEQCLFLVVGIYFKWNGTLSFSSGGWNLF